MKIQNINTNFNTLNIKKLIVTFLLAGFVMTLLSCRCDLEEEKENPEEETNKTLETDVDSIILRKI